MSFSNILKYLSPRSKIGGLEINDDCLRYILLTDKNKPAATITITLPENTISGGKIQNVKYFEAALKELNNQIRKSVKFKKNELIELIVTIPASAVYVSDFDLPQIKDKNLKEAVNLNLKIISPLPIESVYSAWQKIPSLISPFKINVISAFVEKTIPDFLDEAMKKHGFIIAAIEFSGLSMIRSLIEYYPALTSQPHIISHISKRGIDIAINNNKNLIFNYFYEWQADEQSNLDTENVAKILKKETQKTINYYASRFMPKIEEESASSAEESAAAQSPQQSSPRFNIVLVGEKIDIKFLMSISEIIKNELPNKIILPIKKADYIIAMGAAIRGLISRIDDTSMTLTGLDIEEKYKIKQADLLINFWGKIINTAIVFFIALFLSVNFALVAPEQSKIGKNQYLNPSDKDKQRLAAAVNLIREIKENNDIIKSALKAKIFAADYVNFLKILGQKARNSAIEIQNINAGNIANPVVITGISSNKEAISKFKEELSQQEWIQKVELPIQNLIEIEKQTQFKMEIYLKNLP